MKNISEKIKNMRSHSPYMFIVTNNKDKEVKNVEILDAAKNCIPKDREVDIKYGVSNITYEQILSFFVSGFAQDFKLVLIYGEDDQAIQQNVKISQKTLSGSSITVPLFPLMLEVEQASYIKVDFTIDLYTSFIIESIPAKTELKLLFYPSRKFKAVKRHHLFNRNFSLKALWNFITGSNKLYRHLLK